MNRLPYRYIHFLLIGLTLAVVTTGNALSTEQSYPVQRLRYTRALADDEIICNSLTCSEPIPINLKQRETIYYITLASQTILNLDVFPDNQNDLTITLAFNSLSFSDQIFFDIQAYYDNQAPYNDDFPIKNRNTEVVVPGPIRKLEMKIDNDNSRRKRFTLTIYREDADNANGGDNGLTSDNSYRGGIAGASVGSVIGFILFALWCYCIRKRYHLRQQQLRNRQRRYAQPEQQRQVDQPQQSQASVKEIIDINFPETNFEKLKSSFEQKICTICLDDMETKQLCRQLPCQHIFHGQCAKLWLQNQLKKTGKAFCPNCTQEVNFVNS